MFAALAALSLVPSAFSYPTTADLLLKRAEQNGRHDRERAEAVREAFQFAWDGYMEHAFPNDELHPVTNGSGNSRNGWGASAVDALSTAAMMKLPKVVDQILDHVKTIDYSKTDSSCSLFETTIRYLGGMISGYDLLKGPFSDVADADKVEVLLKQSKKLADVMKFGFNSKTGIPANGLNITAQKTDGSDTNGLATTGTLVLEWTRLSDLTGSSEYGDLAQKGESYLLSPKPSTSEPFPGLLGRIINIDTGLFQDDKVSWGGGSDSFYEYLIKMYVYDSEKFEKYKDRWVTAVESTIKHLKSTSSSKPGLTFVSEYSGGKYSHTAGHLTCFHGGNIILGGQILGRRDFVNFGLKLVEGCHATYENTVTKIGPEGYGWDKDRVPEDQKEFYEKSGFYITNSFYDLRPEVIESFYYAYRATGNRKYQQWVWDAFVAINATTRTQSGFSAIRNVNTEGGGEKNDNQESFLFAEVMKYCYIAHMPDAEWQVAGPGKKNKWVFNTEAHPVRVKG